MNLLLPAWTLALREARHFVRDRSRLIGVLAQPFLFWLLIGSGLNASFRPAGTSTNYLTYFFPGILLMVLMFTAIFSTFSIIEDRREGFLQGVLVSPAPRLSIVLGKVLGGAGLGALQGALYLLLLPLPALDLQLSIVGALALFGWMLGVGALLTGIGVIMAWGMTSSQGYHAVMSVLLLPMWIFSGAAFPMEGAPGWLGLIMRVNPLTHGLRLMRSCFAGHAAAPLDMTISIVYVAVALVGILIAAAGLVERRR